jgi:hypothetical protein
MRSSRLPPIGDPTTRSDILNDCVRVAWISAPKVAPSFVNETTDRPFLDQHAVPVEIAVQA